MLSLKQKLALSYSLLLVIILILSIGGAYYFGQLGQAVDRILANNYKSIMAASGMRAALERQNAAALGVAAGRNGPAGEQDRVGAELFERELDAAVRNITEAGEDRIVADIRAQYDAYRQALELFFKTAPEMPTEARRSTYADRLEPPYLTLKNRLDDLRHLNEQAMFVANERALAQSRRAQIITEMLAAFALLSGLLFAWRFTNYIVAPITALTWKAQQMAEGDLDQHLAAEAQDEIGRLAAEFNRMAARLRDARKSDYWQMLIERKKSDAAIDSLYEPVIVTDARGQVTKINRAAAEVFGVSGQDADSNGLSLSNFAFGERILGAVQDAVAMQRPVAVEGDAALVPVKLGGGERSFRLRTTPMRDTDGRLLGTVSILEDVTALRELDQLKTEFISVASSKLDAPLHSLQMALHVLTESHSDALSEKQMELLDSARRDAQQLAQLMRDLLELAEIESGTRRIVAEPLRPVDLARWAVDHYAAAAACKQVKIQNTVAPDLARVMSDRSAVQRIFDNLLSNAIRYTPYMGTVTIEAVERGGRIVFSVKDTGEGIPDAYLPTIFSRFVHVGEKPGGGTGLGLALVKRLVEGQGGQVGVESRVGEGSTFTFTLPVANGAGGRAARE